MGTLFKRPDSKIWWCSYMDRNGKRVRKSTKLSDKQLAKKALAMWESEETQYEIGLKQESKSTETIEQHISQFRSAKSAARKSEQHIERTVQLVRAVAAYNDWKALGDITSDGVAKYAEHMREDSQRAGRTINSMVTAIRQFCRWCVRNKALTADPTATLEKPSNQTDRRIERRMLLPAEWQWLVKALEVESVKNGQSSAERCLMYRLAIETGLRSSELRSLKRSALHLDGPEPHVTVKAGTTKNKKSAKQFVSDELAAALAKHVSRKLPGAVVFNVASRTEMARTLRDDLRDARAMWRQTKQGKTQEADNSDFLKSPNSKGEVIDFHALRHTCGAWLVMQGVTLSEVREIMRHSTIVLTVDCYGHLAPDARSKSRQLLGKMLG